MLRNNQTDGSTGINDGHVTAQLESSKQIKPV